MDSEERMQKAARLLVMTVESLQEHMALIKEQATKNSAKGDQYWAVYSKGLVTIMECNEFVLNDMKKMMGTH